MSYSGLRGTQVAYETRSSKTETSVSSGTYWNFARDCRRIPRQAGSEANACSLESAEMPGADLLPGESAHRHPAKLQAIRNRLRSPGEDARLFPSQANRETPRLFRESEQGSAMRAGYRSGAPTEQPRWHSLLSALLVPSAISRPCAVPIEPDPPR